MEQKFGFLAIVTHVDFELEKKIAPTAAAPHHTHYMQQATTRFKVLYITTPSVPFRSAIV